MIDQDQTPILDSEEMTAISEEQEKARAEAEAEEVRARMEALARARLQAEAEAENAERDLVMASLATMASAKADGPFIEMPPELDIVDGPEGGFGPTFPAELAAAGVAAFHFVREASRVIFAPDIGADERAAVVSVIEAHDPTASNMPQRRQAAFDTAMAFGNRITDQVERKRSNIERASFTAQEIEAKAIVAGETMPADAMLPALAAHKGISAEEYAQQVLDNAATYRQLAIAAVILRRGADGLLEASIDTPEKLSAAMDQLREQAAQFVAQFGLSME